MINDIPTRSHGISRNIQVFCFDVLVNWYLRWSHLFVRVTKLHFRTSKHLRSKDPNKTVQQKKLTLPGKSWKPISPTLSFSLLFHVYSHRPVKTNGLDEESAGCLGGNGNQNGGVSCGWVRRYLFCLKNSATILQLETRTTQTCCEKMVNVFQVHDIF